MTGRGLLLGPYRIVGKGTLGLSLICETCGYRFLKTPWYNPPFRQLGKTKLCPNCSVPLLAKKNGAASPPRIWQPRSYPSKPK